MLALVGCGATRTLPPPSHHRQHRTRPSPPAPRDAGVNFNCLYASAHDRAVVFRDLASAHVDWVRIVVAWETLEPAQGSYSAAYLASLDRCVALSREHRLRVLIVFLGTPVWARSGGTDVTPPAHPYSYAKALRFLAARYRTRVAAWEIWNEENITGFWSTGSARGYVRLLRMSYRVVKRVSPYSLVVFGGTSGNDVRWVRACYRAGAKGYFDVMATHPYPKAWTNVNAAPTLRGVARIWTVMLAHRDPKPIWLTEVGWSAPYAVTAKEQAVALTNALTFTASHLPYVSNVFWFEAKNEVRTVTPGSWQGGLSLISPQLVERPAFKALATWIRQPSS